MSVGKQGPPLCQRVDIWGLHLRMAIQTAHPIIQIIDRNEENVWPALVLRPCNPTVIRLSINRIPNA